MKSTARVVSAIIILMFSQSAPAQTITGAWRGKLGSMRTELKLIKKGDSLMGTSYYFGSKNNYRRYSVKGYFDPETNSVIWWDDELLEAKGGTGMFNAKRDPLLAVADFNCPGEGRMLLQGRATDKNDKDKQEGPVDMMKVANPSFRDEWDFVLENYFVGANHPDIIDSVAGIAFNAPVIPKGFEGTLTPPVPKLAPIPLESPDVKASPKPTTINPGIKMDPPPVNDQTLKSRTPAVAPSPTTISIEQKFATRNNKLQTVIPVTSEKIELRFYDNAQVDGDSIALFLNGRMIFKNIRLTEQAYTVYLKASELQDDNELVMVAENLGSIPPNTSFMIAIVGDKRYEARLYANENSSALVRFVKRQNEK